MELSTIVTMSTILSIVVGGLGFMITLALKS